MDALIPTCLRSPTGAASAFHPYVYASVPGDASSSHWRRLFHARGARGQRRVDTFSCVGGPLRLGVRTSGACGGGEPPRRDDDADDD
jgi:hypothetical protein